LKRRGGVGGPVEHNQELGRPATSPKSSLPLVSISYANQVVGAAKDDLREGAGSAKSIELIGEGQKKVAVILVDTVETAIVHGQVEGTVSLFEDI